MIGEGWLREPEPVVVEVAVREGVQVVRVELQTPS